VLWSETYDRELADVFQVQDELARAIVDALRVELRLTSRAHSALIKPGTADLAAHDLYLKGRFLWNQRTYESLLKAADYFERAIARDSAYAQAYAGLADTYLMLPVYGPARPREAYPKAKAAALRALALDSTLAEAHTSLAYVRAFGDYDWPGAEAEYRRALALDPNYATAHQWYGESLEAHGRFEEALAELERARVLDPLSRIISVLLGNTLRAARRYDDALRQLRATLELDPSFAYTHFYLCWVYLFKRLPHDAVAECERGAELSGRNLVEGMALLAHAYAASGERAKATAILRELEARSRREYVSPYAIALTHLALGDTDRTFAWLDSAVTARDPLLRINILDPTLDPLHADARFARLRARMNLR
jgi:tetratricopeptide (TPR) repeat protein